MKKGKLYIDGVWVDGRGESFSVCSSQDNNTLWSGHSASAEDVEKACAAAEKAFPIWSRLSLENRIGKIEAFCNIVKENLPNIARAISEEVGKPLWESKTEVNAIAAKLAPSLEALNERCSPKSSAGGAITRFSPLGPVGVIGPYNFPIHMPNVHVMPALLAGNTVVVKQSDKAPLSGELLMKCWDEAGLPKGVINLLQGGSSVGQALCENSILNGLFFTGSEFVGKKIAATTAGSGKMVALEMGGNSPLVFWDASDIRAAVLIAIQSCFITSGQRCSSARRIIVRDDELGRQFVEQFVNVASELRIGLPLDDPEPFIGPLVSVEAAKSSLKFQDSLISKGGKVLLKATNSSISKALISPGIIDVTDIECEKDEEVMGPVITITKVESFDVAINLVNDTKYGLAVTLLSEDSELYDEFRARVTAGIISWNAATTGNSAYAAFCGTKSSGNYRPTGFYSCDYTTRAVGGVEKSVAVMPSALPPGLEI